MVQDYFDMVNLLGKGGLVTKCDGRYLVVKEIGEPVQAEWFVIIADGLEAALAFDAMDDAASVWSATPYLSRAEAIGEALDLLAAAPA